MTVHYPLPTAHYPLPTVHCPPFPNCRYEFHRITLAPPLARRILPISWILACVLERLTIFNSHYLVAIKDERFA